MSTKGVVSTPVQQTVNSNAAAGLTANTTNVLSNSEVSSQQSAAEAYQNTISQNDLNKQSRVVNAVGNPTASLSTSSKSIQSHLVNGTLNYFL